jgi:hypothetical protein
MTVTTLITTLATPNVVEFLLRTILHVSTGAEAAIPVLRFGHDMVVPLVHVRVTQVIQHGEIADVFPLFKLWFSNRSWGILRLEFSPAGIPTDTLLHGYSCR